MSKHEGWEGSWDYDPRERQKRVDGSWSEAAAKDAMDNGGFPVSLRPGAVNHPMPGETLVQCAERIQRHAEGWKTEAPRTREFSTGAKRDVDDNKLDFDGCLSPQVLGRYAQYLLDHSFMANGEKRPTDNWQKGIPMASYVKSAWRHFVEWWKWTRSAQIADKVIEEAACGILFNVMGWLHEHLKAKAARADGQAAVSKP